MDYEPTEPARIFSALGDPIRLSIVQQIAQTPELACSALEDTLPVSKPTISYHTKILRQAGIIDVHKRGRNFFYSLRRETLSGLADELLALSSVGRSAAEAPVPARSKRSQPTSAEPAPLKRATGEDSARPGPLLTW